jgi:hypothetical protein
LIRPPAKRLCSIAATALAVAAAALPASALAASGATKLTVGSPAAEALRDQGVRIAAVKPANGGGQKLTLPVASGLAGSKTSLLRHRGGIDLVGRTGAKVRLTKLTLQLGKRSMVEAKLGGEEIRLFEVLSGGRREVDPAAGSVRLNGLRLKLSASGGRALSRRLGLESLPAGRFAALASNARGLTRGTSAPGAGGGDATPGGSAQGSVCPAPSSAGPAPEEPLQVAPKPLGALDVTGATIEWQVRESFIRYIATGEGTSVSGGATADPPTLRPGATEALSYGFHFPFAGSSWLDPGANPADPADDSAAIRFGGALRFLYSGHGIDLLTSAPEIEIAGAKTRAIFAISESGGAAQRQVLVNLDLARAAAVRASGNTYTYERVPGAIPAGTASTTFAGFYPPGTDFGCISVTFTTS